MLVSYSNIVSFNDIFKYLYMYMCVLLLLLIVLTINRLYLASCWPIECCNTWNQVMFNLFSLSEVRDGRKGKESAGI